MESEILDDIKNVRSKTSYSGNITKWMVESMGTNLVGSHWMEKIGTMRNTGG